MMWSILVIVSIYEDIELHGSNVWVFFLADNILISCMVYVMDVMH